MNTMPINNLPRTGLAAIIWLLFALASANTGEAAAPMDSWSQLATFFTPPPRYAHDLGNFKSPLRFDDGRPVKTPADWAQRRREIRETWNHLMGPWPELIAKPRIEELGSKRRDNFTQHRVRVEIAPAQTTDGYLLVPKGSGPFPAVLVPYYDPETSIGLGKTPLRDFAYQLAKRGFVTLAIGSPGGDAWHPDTGTAQCQPLSFLAYVAANCCNALATRRDVNPQRIGVVGHSYGGKWAMFAACLYDRFACGVWSDPGIVFDESRSNVNYWDVWYLGKDAADSRQPGAPTKDNPRTGAYNQLVEGGHDLHELQALMAPRPFLVSGGAEDPPSRWPALNHCVAVNALLGFTNRVGLTSRPAHSPTPESNEQIYQFFEHFLKEPAK